MQGLNKAKRQLRLQKQGFNTEVYGTQVFPIADNGEIESIFIDATASRFQRDEICELASRVGKLCVFNKSAFQVEANDDEEEEQQQYRCCGTSTLKKGQYLKSPMSQGTVIELGRDLMITARHVLQNMNGELIDISDHRIYVHFGSQPEIPKNASLESLGWIPLEPYSFEHTENSCSACKNNRDFIFLKRLDSHSSASTRMPSVLPSGANGVQLLYRVFCNCCNTCKNVTLARPNRFVVLGFYDSVSTEALEDFFQEMGVLTKDECIRFYKEYHARALNRKLILCERECTSSTSSREDASVCVTATSEECTHILKHNCLTASGVSGGMVALVNDSRIPLFCAMHLAKDSTKKGQCLKANVFIASASTTDA